MIACGKWPSGIRWWLVIACGKRSSGIFWLAIACGKWHALAIDGLWQASKQQAMVCDRVASFGPMYSQARLCFDIASCILALR